MAKKKAPKKKTKKAAPAKKAVKKAKPAKKSAVKAKAKTKAPPSKKASAAAARKAQRMPLVNTYRPAPNEKELGTVDDYFAKVGVIALFMKNELAVGGTIHVHGHTTDLTQVVDSIQIDRKPIQNAKKGDSIGIKVSERCRKGDRVFRVD